MSEEVVKIFIGCDRSQLIAFKTLEHSIKRNTNYHVECVAIDNSMMPVCQSRFDQPYTNFSFARFGIPSFTGYKGRAIYLDADMLVLTDIAELWNMDFQEAKVLLLDPADKKTRKRQSKRRKQTAVMLLNCSSLQDWIPEKIIGNLGRLYDRTELMSLRIFPKRDIREAIPLVWNCMDWCREGESKLVHFTKIETQPWVYPEHVCGHLWLQELKMMMAEGKLDEKFIREEVKLGLVRPSLLAELGFDKVNKTLLEVDAEAGFQMHKEMLERYEQRRNLLKKNKLLRYFRAMLFFILSFRLWTLSKEEK